MEKSKDSIELYSNQILSLAANIPLTERLLSPDITVTKRSRLCGSTVTIDLIMKNEIIVDYAHEIKACALGQASASILAKDILGKTSTQIIKARNSVVQMLNNVNYSHDIFSDYEVLLPASQFKNRHDSILLPLDATVEGIDKILSAL